MPPQAIPVPPPTPQPAQGSSCHLTPASASPAVPQALTSLAVMKKFHGSSVPSPRMKKISQTALYLHKVCGKKTFFCGKTDGAPQGAVSTGREGSCCSQPLPQPLLASRDTALPRGSARMGPLVSYSSVTH